MCGRWDVCSGSCSVRDYYPVLRMPLCMPLPTQPIPMLLMPPPAAAGKPMFPGRDYLHQLQVITELIGSPSDQA